MPDGEDSLEDLIALMRGHAVTVLTGAGISTESGIPDYRGPQTRDKPRNPIQHREFIADAEVRRRYWARATVGWRRFAAATPNEGHRALASLQRHGVVTGLITQNVDRLHQAAGSEALELHGTLHEVTCLSCGAVEDRAAVHARMMERNEGLVTEVATLAPDGDVDLCASVVEAFDVAPCLRCGGALKPHVVFFGGSVPKSTVERAYAMVERAGALVVVGSSLTVFSGYRFVRRAAERGIVVGILNLGETRGDPQAQIRVNAPAGVSLRRLADALT